MSEQTPIEITQILKESPNLPKANEIGYFFMENQVVWAMEEYSKHKLNQLQAKHEEELKEAVIEAYLQGFKISGEGYNGEYPFEGYSNEKISNDIEAEQYYKANHETN